MAWNRFHALQCFSRGGSSLSMCRQLQQKKKRTKVGQTVSAPFRHSLVTGPPLINPRPHPGWAQCSGWGRRRRRCRPQTGRLLRWQGRHPERRREKHFKYRVLLWSYLYTAIPRLSTLRNSSSCNSGVYLLVSCLYLPSPHCLSFHLHLFHS